MYILYIHLSYDITVIQWITLYHKNHMATHITLWCKHVMLLTTLVSAMHFRIEVMFILKDIKSDCKGLYGKQNLTLVVISYEIYERSLRILHLWSFHMKFMK